MFVNAICPFGVSGKGVGANLILFQIGKLWVHNKCSGEKIRLKKDSMFRRKRSKSEGLPPNRVNSTQVRSVKTRSKLFQFFDALLLRLENQMVVWTQLKQELLQCRVVLGSYY